MTERWKRELSRIDEVQPDEGLLERARRGPTRGEPQPSRASRVGTVVLAFAAVALAGVLLVRAFGWPGGRTEVASEVTPTAVIDEGPMPWMAVLKQQPRSEMEALYSGKLEERNGCLMMGGGLPIWPQGFWMMRSEGQTLVMDEQDRPVGALGGDIRMSGGYVPWRNDVEALQQTITEPIPQACLEDLRNVWMVGETHPLSTAALTAEQQRALWGVAQRLAKNLTTQPFTAHAVVGTPEQIMGMRIGAFGGAIRTVPGSRWALVQLEGDFTLYRPGSTEDLKGSALWFVSYLSDPIVPNPTDWGVLAEPVDLTQLGDVVELGTEVSRNPPLETLPGYGAPSVAKISCTADGVLLHTPVVAAQRDGVTFDIDNPAGFEQVGWFPTDSDATWGASIGRERRVVWGQMPPGRYTVGCGPESANNANDLVGATAIVEVTDPTSYWHPYEPDCIGEKKKTSTASYLASKVFTSRSEDDQFVYSKDFTYEGESTIRSRVPGILDSDILDYRGYPEGKRVMGDDSFRVVRDGRVVAGVAVLHRSPDSLSFWVEACPSSGIRAVT